MEKVVENIQEEAEKILQRINNIAPNLHCVCLIFESFVSQKLEHREGWFDSSSEAVNFATRLEEEYKSLQERGLIGAFHVYRF